MRPSADAVSDRRGVRIVVGAGFGVLALVAIWAGTTALVAFAAAVLVLAYLELRRILAPAASRVSLLAGAAATVALVVLASRGDPDALPWVLGALVVGLLVLRIVGVELGRSGISGATSDLGATATAVGLVGLLGAHVLLVRAVPIFGFEGALVFALIVLAHAAGGVLGGILGGPSLTDEVGSARTWGSAAAGAVGAMIAGLVVGFVFTPPFDVGSGLLVGLGAGLLVPVGELAAASIKQGAGLDPRDGYLPGLGGVLDLVSGSILAAPAFYWGFRILVV